MNISDGFVGWPVELETRYRRVGCWNGLTFGSYLNRWSERFGEREALVDGLVRISYLEFADLSSALATSLLHLGLRRGDSVVLQLPNSWELVVAFFGCTLIGVAPVMALPGHRSHEMAYFVKHASAKAVIVPGILRDFDHLEMAKALRDSIDGLDVVITTDPRRDERSLFFSDLLNGGRIYDVDGLQKNRPDSGDIALFLLSGGTTGVPKLIPRSHDDYGYNFRQSSEICGLTRSDVYMAVLPASHNFPLACPGILGALSVGAKTVLSSSPDPASALKIIETERVTITSVVPSIAQRWIEVVDAGSPFDISSLELLQVGGARLAPEIARRVRPTLRCRLQQVFGMAEGLINFTSITDSDEVTCETQGRPMSPWDEVLVVDELDQPVAKGEVGQLIVQGPYTLRGYYRAAAHNAKCFTEDGWYRSGDVVRWHESGNLEVLGRIKDLINRGGEKISAEEVENLVYRLPNAEQVAAIPVADDATGERICVFVVLRDRAAGMSLEEIHDAFSRFGVARYKFPEELRIVNDLPFTNVGKIDKNRLRSEVEAQR